jgi:hypothetical protein
MQAKKLKRKEIKERAFVIAKLFASFLFYLLAPVLV